MDKYWPGETSFVCNVAHKNKKVAHPWGQFHKTIGEKRRCTSARSLVQLASPKALLPTLQVKSTRI